MSKLDDIFNELEAINKPRTGLIGYLPQTKQALKDLMLELMNETPDDPNWYGVLQEKVNDL